jgi:hypothetical protein
MSEKDTVETAEDAQEATEATAVTEDTNEAEDGATDAPEPSWNPEKAREKIRKANAEAKALRERAKAAEDKAKGAENAEKRAADLEAKLLRLQVGYKYGLPEDLVDRLRGDSEEALAADAEKLLDLVSPRKTGSKPVEKLRPGGAPAQDDDEDDPKALLASVRARYS